MLYLAEGEHAIDDAAKDDMLAVEEVAFCCGDEELEMQGVGGWLVGW